MRFLQVLVALCFIALGGVFSALNPQPTLLDFGVFQVPSTMGVAMLFFLLGGALLGGGLVAVAVAWPLRRRLKRLERIEQGLAPAAPVMAADADSPAIAPVSMVAPPSP
jgi:uncharacterized integral membrane protein